MSKIDDFYKIDLLHNGDFVAAPNGDFSLAKGSVNLRQALFHRLITNQGTLVHRPQFGVGVKNFQNKTGSISKQKELAAIIREQFEQDERVEELVSVKIKNLNIDGQFEVTYKVRVSGGSLEEETINPFGEQTI